MRDLPHSTYASQTPAFNLSIEYGQIHDAIQKLVSIIYRPAFAKSLSKALATSADGTLMCDVNRDVDEAIIQVPTVGYHVPFSDDESEAEFDREQ